jgi:serine/threonine protein kinase
MEPYGHAADWWSLGVIAFCLITGEVGLFFYSIIVIAVANLQLVLPIFAAALINGFVIRC